MDEAPQPLPEQETKADQKGEDDVDWLRLRLATTPPPEALDERRSPGTTPATTTTTTTTSELRLFDDGPSSSSTPVEPPTVSCHMIRVVSPARRPAAGLWFVLQVDRTRGDEQPPLPQIAKSYLRIRDGGMTVRLLIKYIINRLPPNAEEEAEVEITCREQVLHPSLTLQYVRDNIWCARDAVLILPDSPNIDHVMRLLYRRRTSGMTR